MTASNYSGSPSSNVWPLKVNEVWMCNGGLSLVSGLAWQRTIGRWSDSADPAVFMETHQRPVGCEKPSSAKWAAYKTGNKTAAQRTGRGRYSRRTESNTAEHNRVQQSSAEYSRAQLKTLQTRSIDDGGTTVKSNKMFVWSFFPVLLKVLVITCRDLHDQRSAAALCYQQVSTVRSGFAGCS